LLCVPRSGWPEEPLLLAGLARSLPVRIAAREVLGDRRLLGEALSALGPRPPPGCGLDLGGAEAVAEAVVEAVS